MPIVKCNCRQSSYGGVKMVDFYDARLGPGLRIANPVKRREGQAPAARCVVCAKIAPVAADFPPDNF